MAVLEAVQVLQEQYCQILYKNSSLNRLWEFIIGHVMKTMLLILHPTALRRKQFLSPLPSYELRNVGLR